MSIKIERTLDGAYHIRAGNEEVVLRKSDLKVIADQAVADGILKTGDRPGITNPNREEAEAAFIKFVNDQPGYACGYVTMYIVSVLITIFLFGCLAVIAAAVIYSLFKRA